MGTPLFDKRAWNGAKNFLTLVGKGYLSDPVGTSLYFFRRRDENDLAAYRYLRRTNSLEGEVHQNIKQRFGSFNSSIQLAVNLIVEYRTRHNLKVSKISHTIMKKKSSQKAHVYLIRWVTLSRTGKKYNGHYDIWRMDDIQLACLSRDDKLPELWNGWRNTKLLISTEEKI